MEVLDEFWRIAVSKFGQDTSLVLVSIIGAIAYAFARYILKILKQLACYLSSRRRALRAVGRIEHRDGPREGAGVWVARPIEQPNDYKSKLTTAKVLAIANLKGGVGKTTLAANIGAFLASDPSWRKRVLLIDLDYQGSLSSMALPDDDRWLPPHGQDSIATRAISGDLESSVFVSCAKPTKQEPRLQVITAHYDLAQADNRLLVEWLLRCRQKSARSMRHRIADLFYGQVFRMHDVRYNLAELLHSESVRDAFDLVIIDCPPRLTTGTIQALCASSHLLVPTILDRPSAEAVVAFCEQVEGLKKAQICPHLSSMGVVATRYRSGYVVARQAMQKIRDELRDRALDTILLDESTYVPQTVALVREADEGIAYFVMGNSQQEVQARDAVAKLSRYVASQMGIPTALGFH